MEETALYHHIGIRNVFHFNYQLTTSNFMLPAMLYWQILCIMQIFVKKKKKSRLLHVSKNSAEAAQKEFSMQ